MTLQDNNSRHKKALFIEALLFNLMIAAFLLYFFSPFFETNDDSGLMTLVTGARGERDPHMVHSNYLLGLVLTSLFKAAPEVQWTSLFQIILLLLSNVFLTYAFFVRNKSIFFRILTVSVVFWFSYEGYVCIQYTKSGGFITAAGLMILFIGLLEKPADRLLVAAGFLLSVIGSFYRFQQAACITAIFASMAVYIIACRIQKEKTGREVVVSLIIGICLVSTVAGLRVYDRAQYKEEEWAYYLQFDKYRTEVIDYGVPSFKEHKEEYEAVGIDKTAYELMRKWTFQDEEKFTPEVFRQIAGFRDKKTIDLSFIKAFFRDLCGGLMQENTFCIFLILTAGWLLYGKRGVKEWTTLIITLLTITLLYFYLYYAGRFMIHRVDAAIWFAASLITLFLYDEKKKKNPVPLIAALLAAVVFAGIVPWKDNIGTGFRSDLRIDPNEKKAIEEINADQKHIYLTKIGTLSFIDAYGALEPAPYRSSDNMYPLGGWAAETPAYKAVLRKYEITNPFREMIDNPEVLLIDNRIKKTVAYLNRWYADDAEAEFVKEINGHKVYRIVTASGRTASEE